MATKNEQEEELVDKFLSNKDALTELRNSSEEDINLFMKYGVNQINNKTTAELAEDFLKLIKVYPDFFDSRDISKIKRNIEVEKE